jgi:hypothetical protein
MSYHYSIDLSSFAACPCMNNLSVATSNSSRVAIAKPLSQEPRENNLKINQWPVATVISIVFTSLFIATILILKLVYSSADEFRSNENRYDLVLFKAPSSSNQKNSGMNSRKMFENDEARKHNLKVVADSGFDVTTLEISRISAAYSKKYLTTDSNKP